MSIIHLIPFDIKYDNTEVIKLSKGNIMLQKFSPVKPATPSYFGEFGQIYHSVNLILGQTGQIFGQIDILPCRHPSYKHTTALYPECYAAIKMQLEWYAAIKIYLLKGHWTTSASSPDFFRKIWELYTIRSVYLWSECMFNFTCNFNLITKICEFFLQRPFLKVYF